VRSHQMDGLRHAISGWGCHGLPIEWKIEEQLPPKVKQDDVPINDFRLPSCATFVPAALGSMCSARNFKRLGITGKLGDSLS